MMGAVEAAMPAAELIAEELGGAENIVRKAWGSALSYPSGRTCWVHYRSPSTGTELLVLAMVWSRKMYGETYNCVKLVSEDMGPFEVDVPDVIWENRPPTPDSEFAREWRARVEEFRASMPLMVRNLTDDDVGREFVLDDGKTATYAGRRNVTRKTVVPVFNLEGEGLRRLHDWRNRRCRPAEAAVPA